MFGAILPLCVININSVSFSIPFPIKDNSYETVSILAIFNKLYFDPTFRTLEHPNFVIKAFTNKLFASIDN